MQHIEQLLSLASLFKTRAINKLSKFIKEADRESLLRGLEGLLVVSIPEDVFDEWFAKNASVLGDALDYEWFSTHTPENDFILLSDSKGGNPNESLRKIISKNLYNQPNFVSSTESILINHGIIPRLHIVSGKFDYKDNPGIENISPQFAHEAYLVQALANISWNTIDDVFLKHVENFYKKNKEKVDSLRRFFAKPPAYLGGGSDGSAFDIGNGLVLKIFGDKFSHDAALAAQERLHKFPEIAKTEAMIYDVGLLGRLGGKKIFYSIMEKMKPINRSGPEHKLMYNILAIIYEEIMPLINSKEWLKDKENINDPKTYPNLKVKVKSASRSIGKRIRENNRTLLQKLKSTYDLNSFWLDNLVEEILMKWLTSRGDLHAGNIGVTNYGRFRYFDPSYKDWANKLNLPTGRIG